MKIILLWGLLLAVAFVNAHDSWPDDEDWSEGSVDDDDSFYMSGSGMEEKDGDLDDNGEDNLDLDDFEGEGHDHHDEYDDYDDDYSDDDDAGLEFQGHRRSRRSPKPCKINGCKVCGLFQLNCLKCKKGYKLKGSGCTKALPTPAPPPKIHRCTAVSNCLDCPGTGMPWFRSCKKCAQGWSLKKTTFRTICTKKCPQGYQSKNGKNGLQCSAITLKCPKMPGCEHCPTDRSCTKCSGNLSLYDDISSSKCVKTCPFSYYTVIKNGKRVCKQQDGCLDRNCNSCKTGWLKLLTPDRNGHICHDNQSGCPSGYTLIWNIFCKKCSKGCKKCNTNGCEVCNKGFSLYSGKRKIFGLITTTVPPSCFKNCPTGFRKVLVQGKGHQCKKGQKKIKPATGDLP